MVLLENRTQHPYSYKEVEVLIGVNELSDSDWALIKDRPGVQSRLRRNAFVLLRESKAAADKAAADKAAADKAAADKAAAEKAAAEKAAAEKAAAEKAAAEKAAAEKAAAEKAAKKPKAKDGAGGKDW